MNIRYQLLVLDAKFEAAKIAVGYALLRAWCRIRRKDLA